MRSLAVIGVEILYLCWFSCRHDECYLGIKEPEESLILRLHIVIDLEVYMNKAPCHFLDHTSEDMVERLEGLAVHTDDERTIYRLYMDIHIFTCHDGLYLFECDTESVPELCNEGLYCVLHTNKG